MILSTFERYVKDLLVKNFDPSVKAEKRLRVVADLNKFRFMGDESIWKQKRGKAHKILTVYFDDEFVCGLNEKTPPEQLQVDFLKGIHKLVMENKIIVNKHLSDQADIVEKEVKTATKKAEKKRIDDLPDKTPVEKLAKEATKRVSRKKKKHPSSIATRPNA